MRILSLQLLVHLDLIGLKPGADAHFRPLNLHLQPHTVLSYHQVFLEIFYIQRSYKHYRKIGIELRVKYLEA